MSIQANRLYDHGLPMENDMSGKFKRGAINTLRAWSTTIIHNNKAHCIIIVINDNCHCDIC